MIQADTTRAPEFLRYVWPDGRLVPEDFVALRDRLRDEGLLTRTTRSLVDGRTLRELPTLDQIRSAIAAVEQSRNYPAAMAFLVAPGVQFGVARQITLLMPDSVTGAVFTDEGAAWEWLETLP